MKKSTITVLIPARNEEENIARAVKSALWADQVIVLWDGNDKTKEIAQRLGAKVIIRNRSDKQSFVSVQKNINWAIDNIDSDWFLRIDADEEITPKLRDEIQKTINKGGGIVAYGIPRNQYFWGDFLRGGDWYYDRLVRLFKKGKARYEPIVPVHEQFQVFGKTGYLKNRLNHYSHPNLSEAIKKFQLYTDIESQNLKISKGEALAKMVYLPPYVFLRWFFYHHGWRDGIRGLVAGAMRAWYEFLIYSKFIFRSPKSNN